MMEIRLLNGIITLVDDEDFEYLNQWKWYFHPGRNTAYAFRNERMKKNKTIYMHRIIANALGRLQVDHIDGNGLNNQRNNLRLCTAKENSHHLKRKSNNTSGYTGVVWIKRINRWGARIETNGKQIYICVSKNPVDAARAYDNKARELFGEFARLNFPEAIP